MFECDSCGNVFDDWEKCCDEEYDGCICTACNIVIKRLRFQGVDDEY